MSHDQIHKNWQDFLKSFDESFDSELNNQEIALMVDRSHPDASSEEKMIYAINIYQKLRTNALIENVLQNFEKLTKD